MPTELHRDKPGKYPSTEGVLIGRKWAGYPNLTFYGYYAVQFISCRSRNDCLPLGLGEGKVFKQSFLFIKLIGVILC
jgi:hypothetical protein